MHLKMRKVVITAVVLAVFAFPAQAEALSWQAYQASLGLAVEPFSVLAETPNNAFGAIDENIMATATEESFTDKVGELWQSTKDKAGELYEAGKEKAPEIIDKGKEVAGAAADKAGELYETGKEKLPELIEGAKEGISDAQDAISDWNASQQDQFWDWVDGQTGGQTSGSTGIKQPSGPTANQAPVTPVIPNQTAPKAESPTPENPPADGMQNPEADYGDGEGDYQTNKVPEVDIAYVMIGALAVAFCATMLWSLAKYSKARKETERMRNDCKKCEEWLNQREHGRRNDD